MKKTLEHYKKAIKFRYDEVKNDDVAGLLLNPSPANLKALCSIKAEENKGIDDQSIFRRFFDVSENDDLLKKIDTFDTDKLRPVGNFLKGKTTSTSKTILELIAILIDFEPRPYGKFSKLSDENTFETKMNSDETNTIRTEKSKKKKKEKKPEKPPVVIVLSEEMKAKDMEASLRANNVSEKNQVRKMQNWKLYAAFGLLILTSGYYLKQEYYPPKNCMQWATDRYEAVSCKGAKIQSLYEPRIIEWNAELIAFRKLTISEKTKFFINGKPAVWYSKDNTVVEFFNAPGVHPITGESLKPVTRHIVETYGKVR